MKLNATTLLIIVAVLAVVWFIYSEIQKTRAEIAAAAGRIPQLPSGPFSKIGLGLDATAGGIIQAKSGLQSAWNEIW